MIFVHVSVKSACPSPSVTRIAPAPYESSLNLQKKPIKTFHFPFAWSLNLDVIAIFLLICISRAILTSAHPPEFSLRNISVRNMVWHPGNLLLRTTPRACFLQRFKCFPKFFGRKKSHNCSWGSMRRAWSEWSWSMLRCVVSHARHQFESVYQQRRLKHHGRAAHFDWQVVGLSSGPWQFPVLATGSS